ncbi:MAG: CPBP family intramembrane metalloprotease [Clostridia bacterium]|nr:CPBP family intramembrane metalloprotease [Clostridia bacterium]
MTLIAFIAWKLFFRKEEAVPVKVLIAANIIAALAFAAGHLPSTITLFGTLTPMIVFRCFLLNGAFGLIFGRLYRKFGIQYAMLSHALLHIVSKTIWLILL